ncbi:MAG: extracellular solute-binding protein [Clostridiales bacterium]|nr:extracellular solute-binding protein [Clostridiales bacterium]
MRKTFFRIALCALAVVLSVGCMSACKTPVAAENFCVHGKSIVDGCYECGTACKHGIHLDRACAECEREATYCEHGLPRVDCRICTPLEVAKINFWGWGDATESEVFTELVRKFNEEYRGVVEVVYSNKSQAEYEQTTHIALAGRSGPDVFYIGDGDAKQWITQGYASPLDDYLATSTIVDPDDIWDSALQRYRYDPLAVQSRPGDPLYALPKDIGPTVIYYNRTAMQNADVDVSEISVFEEELAAYNTANSKNYPARGFFLVNGAGNIVTVEDMNVTVASMKAAGMKRIFNNRIPMTWEETVALSKLLTRDNAYNSQAPTRWGYYTEWWFNYGWSVGGNCVKFDENDNVWKFTLGDRTQLRNPQTNQLMPSQFDAFAHFVQLSQPRTNTNIDGNGMSGLAITPPPQSDKVGRFRAGGASNGIAMLVDGRWTTAVLRRTPPAFDWDVAPLPRAATGVEAGHSGSVGLAINSKSVLKNTSWKLIEYLAGPEGQTAQSLTGFNIPNQKSIANSEVFLQSDQKPANAAIFLRAAEVQGPGDWAFLPDDSWIEYWAPTLNTTVRGGTMDLTTFFNTVQDATNVALARYQTPTLA